MHPSLIGIYFIHTSSAYDNSVEVDSPSMNCVIQNVEVFVDRFVLQAWKSGNRHRFGQSGDRRMPLNLKTADLVLY